MKATLKCLRKFSDNFIISNKTYSLNNFYYFENTLFIPFFFSESCFFFNYLRLPYLENLLKCGEKMDQIETAQVPSILRELLSIYLSFYRSILLYISFFLSIYLTIFLFISLSIVDITDCGDPEVPVGALVERDQRTVNYRYIIILSIHPINLRSR